MSTIIKTLREAKGLTQAQVAKEVGVSQQAVVQWEAGDTAPRGKNLIKAAEVLGTDVRTIKDNRSMGVDIQEFKQELFDLLAEKHKGAVALETKDKGQRWAFDLMLDGHAVEVVPGDDGTELYMLHALWQLATYHAATDATATLILVGHPSSVNAHVAQQRLTAKAHFVGITVLQAREMSDVTDVIGTLNLG